MTFAAPIPFSEAIKSLTQRSVLPTNLSSAEIRDMDRDIRARSIISAKNNLEALLEATKDKVLQILKPDVPLVHSTQDPKLGTGTLGMNPATARADLKQVIKKLGYTPPEGKRGTIEDLGSDPRLNLVIKTNVDIAQGFGQTLQGLAEGAIDAFPAQELYRLESRKEPRDWLQRFQIAGLSTGSTTGWTIAGGRMIALKTHPIWDALGDSDLFDDALDTSWAPFAFGSGMYTRDVPRSETIALGLLEPGQRVEPKLPKFAEALTGVAA